MRAGFLLLAIAAVIGVNFAIPTGYKDDQDVWKYIDISEADIDTFFFDLPPLEETSCLYLEFGIKADRDALLILSPYNEVDDNSYEIVFGAEGNLFTCILKGHGTKPVVDETTLDLLTGDWRYFWIRLEGGLLSVGKDGEEEPFTQFYDETPFKVGYVGVKSIMSASSWKFFLPGFGNDRYHQEIGEDGGEYFTFPSLPSCNCKWYLEFCVQAEGNTLLTFSPEDKLVNNVYQIMIGAMDNIFTCIVRENGTKPVVDVTTLDILSKDNETCFWVSLEDGTLEFGNFGEETPIASYTDPDPFDVSHIGVSSMGASSWTFFFPCSADPRRIDVGTPGEYQFVLPELPQPQDCFYLRFGVYAQANAVITFSPVNEMSENIYEVILGAAGNIFTCIRRGKDTKPVVDETTLDILENCWQYFWIRFTRGKLEVGKDGSDTPFAVYFDPDPFPVSWVGVTSLEHSSSWKFFTHGFARKEFFYHVTDSIPFNFVFPKFLTTNFYFEFGVRAQSDALLTFSPKNAPLKKIYQIVLGAENNLFNCIIKDKGTKPIVDFYSYFELSSCEYQYFWVRFNNGLLEVGQYGCLDAFASFQDPDPYEVYYLGVGGMSSETFWKVYFPCDYSNYVCGGEQLNMHCDAGTINIKRALYGRENLLYCNSADCHNDSNGAVEFCGDVFDSMNVVQRECQGEKTCVINADESYFGDVCNENQYLHVDYYCLGEQTVNACQDEDLEIACDDGYINIVDAVYGRVVDDICADDGQAASSDCQSPDAKSKAIETCQGRESCSLPATNYVFGDPCSDSSKYLQVTYACDADPYGGTIRPAPFVETEYTIDTPGEYTFLEYEFQHKCLYLVFGVKAKANAFITLSPSQGLEDNIYEVMIGAADNIFVCLRKYRDTDPVVDVTSLDILEDRYQFFWISFCKGRLAVGFYGDNSPLAAYVDEDPFDVSYVGFTTFGVESQWIFYLEHFGAFLLESNNRQSPFYPDVVLDAASGYEFEFIIRGDEDATLWLTPRPYADYEDALLVHIGSHGNTYNYIEYQGQVVVSSHGALLNGKEDRVFKLKYSANKIQLLNGDGYVILEAAGIPADNVIYLGFHSPDGISYWWLYDLYFPFTVSDDGHSWSGNSFIRSYGCSSEISLDCEEKYIYIYDASYGRQNNRICRYDPIYQTDGCYSDHTVDYVRENCHNKQTCTYDASVLESYCHETTKYFQWTYVCVNEVITNRIVDSYPSSQPQPPSEDNVFETTESTEDFTFPLPKLQDDSYFIYFCVKSSAEVRIALSSENEVQDDMYIIAITATSVSIAQGSNVPTEAAAEDLLASNEYRCFWIAFYNGQIAIGRYGDYYPLLLNQETGAVAPGISYVGIASSAPDAAWRVYTEGSGEYKYKSDRSRLYSPNLANLPQRMFKFCFGIKAEGSAVLRVGPEDYDEGGYPLIISIGSAGNTKITLQYSDWSAELEEASVLSTDTVRYFCLVLLDDCISLLDEDGNVLLEGVDVVDYRYLRRISFYNIDYVGYWYIRGIPFRFPATAPVSITTPTYSTYSTTYSSSTPTSPTTTAPVATTTPTYSTYSTTYSSSTPTSPTTTAPVATTTPTSPTTTTQVPTTTPTSPTTTTQVPTTTPTSPTTTTQVPTTTPTSPASTPTSPTTTTPVPTTTPTYSTTTVPVATLPPTSPTTTPTTPTTSPTSPTTSAWVSFTTPSECSLPPEDILLDIQNPGEVKFELPEVDFETFELYFDLKLEGCSILILSDQKSQSPASYEIGFGCEDGGNYLKVNSEDYPRDTDDTASFLDDAWHHVHIIYKYGFAVVFVDDGDDPILFAYFQSSLIIKHFGITGTGASWWLFPAEGFGAKSYEVDSSTYYYLPILHTDEYVIPFEVRACSEVVLHLVEDIIDVGSSDVEIVLGSNGNSESTISYSGVTNTYEGDVLKLDDVTSFVLERTVGDNHIKLIDAEGNVLLEVGYVRTAHNYIAFTPSEGVSYWYFYWCPFQFEDIVGGTSSVSPTTSTRSPTTTPTPECDAGWEEYQGHCYLFESYLTSNLDDAIDRCDSRCARLIEIDSADEEAFVVSRVPDHLGFVQFLLDISFLDDVTIGFSPDHYLSDVDQTGYWNIESVPVRGNTAVCFAVTNDLPVWTSGPCPFFTPTGLVCEIDLANRLC